MTIISTISTQGLSSVSPRKTSFSSQRFLPISTIAMKFTEEEEPLTPLGQDWQEDEYYQTANAFFSSSTVAALASSNARALLNGSKSAPIIRNSSPEPAAVSACSALFPTSSPVSDSSRTRLVETLMHTVALAWDRYMALHQQSSSSTSFSDGDRSSPLPSFGLVVSDSDRSIVHVSAEFEMLTGYTRADSLGRSAAFLQGKLTSESAITVLRSALKEKRPCQVLLINYKKDGQPFWNLLTIAPSFATDGSIDRWFGIQMVANESWRIDRPMPLFPWTHYPLPSIHPKKTKKAIAAAKKEESAVKSSVVVIEEIEEKTTCPPPRAVPLSFIAETVLPTRHGRYRVRAYRQLDDSGNPTDVEIMVIVHGHPELIKHNVPVRIHDACFTSEVIHSLKCDCREQLEYAMKYIRDAKDGVVIYLPQEGRGIGLSNKIKAYAMQELGLDTVDANRALGFPDDNRAYNAVPSILQDLQIQSVRLLSNNTRKFDVMRALGVQINGRLPVLVLPTFVDEHGQSNGIRLTAQVAEGAPEYVKRDTKYAENYVKAKIARMNHMQYAQDI